MGRWFPSIYDFAMNPLERGVFLQIRKAIIMKAKGIVLEIGSGTGINFPLYQGVSRVDAIEPNPMMVERSLSKQQRASVPISIYSESAENLSFQQDMYDSVIATLVFCTIPNPVLAIEEIKRVSKDGATILFFEHIRMKQPALAKLQDILNPFWKTVCDGCHLNRDTLEIVRNSGLEIKKVNSFYKGLFVVIECKNSKKC